MAVMSTKNFLNEPVLILNVNFEPLHVCNTRRALALVLTGKAKILLNGRGTIRTSSTEYDIPSVIKLQYMVKRPRPRVNLSKREVLHRDDYTCQYCGRKALNLTIDHVMPRHRGGSHTWSNLAAACPSCNRRKGGKLLDQANMKLLRPPCEPPASANYRFRRYLTTHQEWEQFISGW